MLVGEEERRGCVSVRGRERDKDMEREGSKSIF